TFHDQVGYWLWEPAAKLITMTIAIPRGQVLLAAGPAEPEATELELRAERGTTGYGILSNPFLGQAFRTLSFRIHVTIEAAGTWRYEEETLLEIPGRTEHFRHTDRNRLTRVAAPSPNPLASASLPAA